MSFVPATLLQAKQFPQDGFELEQLVITGQGEGLRATAFEEAKLKGVNEAPC